MSVTANVAPAALKKVMINAKTGNLEEAETIDKTLLLLHQR